MICVGHTDLADVVEQAGDVHALDHLLPQTQLERAIFEAYTPTRSEWPRV